MLKAVGISKVYGDLQVLDTVDFTLEKSEIVSIVGASGAGKSTLLHILGTLDTPDTGEILINGENITKMKANQLAQFRNQYIGFVFQFHNLLPEFTALENICMPGYIAQKPEAEVVKRAKELLEMLNLSSRADHKPQALSGGEQQRVAIARALINKPHIVFGDEPSGNLDSKSAKELHQLFLDLRKELECAFVLVTHNNELANMADRKLEMADGKLI
ncbi:ABC transporter ATP-binding protein [Aureibacter tunicatorum]|nr:ABC transporter ATP-binding protein [Aureibacter tunicatorum]